MEKKKSNPRISFIAAMVIFGSVGIFRKFIPNSSSLIALIRGIIGTAFLLAYLLVRKQQLNKTAVRQCFPLLLLSGAAIGFNWILLFESYRYASVAVATLCYYLAPILVILVAPLVLGKKLTMKKGFCAFTALCGMILVSGIFNASFSGTSEFKGIGYGIGAAILYAGVILVNKRIPEVPALDKTVCQLGFASAALLPYVLLTVPGEDFAFAPLSALLVITMGIVHTGLAYLLYFSSIGKLEAHTVALFSYIDPVLAIIFSALLLQEPIGLTEVIGAVLILGSAFISEKQ